MVDYSELVDIRETCFTAKVHDSDYGMIPTIESGYADWHQTGTNNNYQLQIETQNIRYKTGGGGGAGAHGPHEDSFKYNRW